MGTIPRVLIATVVMIGVAASAAVADSSPPNILFILADDVGREVLGCYGGSSYHTPQLDSLAASGTRFTHAYAMAVCHPTRVTLLTGQYPFRLGHPEWGTFPVAAERRTVAHVLKDAGYATAVAGKWQLAMLKDDLEHPHRLGFDEYCLFGWHEGPRYYQPHIWQNGRLRRDVHDRYGPDVYCEFLIDFITRNKQGPFFAFYSMALCHDVTDDLAQPVPFGPHGRYDSYEEMVAAMDGRVGRIVGALQAHGLRQRTLVIFFADNGSPKKYIATAVDGQFVETPVVSAWGELMVPGGKSQLIDWGTRVPLLASWPGTVTAGQVSDALIDVSDMLPTLAELSGAELPMNVTLDGFSFARNLFGHTTSSRNWVFAEHKGRSFVKDRRWKLYDDKQFFDVAADPDEEHPLSLESLSPEALTAYQRLTKQLPVRED